MTKAMRGLEVASKGEENIDLCVEKSRGWWRLTPPPPPPAAAVTRLLGGREKKGGRDGSGKEGKKAQKEIRRREG